MRTLDLVEGVDLDEAHGERADRGQVRVAFVFVVEDGIPEGVGCPELRFLALGGELGKRISDFDGGEIDFGSCDYR